MAGGLLLREGSESHDMKMAVVAVPITLIHKGSSALHHGCDAGWLDCLFFGRTHNAR